MEEEKKKHVVKLETKVTVDSQTPEFQIEKRHAAIKAALVSATAGLASTTASLASQAFILDDIGDGGLPPGGAPPPVPWGEVIIGPIWYQKNAGLGDIFVEAIEVSFWE
jgi:hypothetical protein